MKSQIEQRPASPDSQISKSITPKFLKRRPEYALYKRIAQQRQRKVDDQTDFAGFYSPQKRIEPLKFQISSTLQTYKSIDHFHRPIQQNDEKLGNASTPSIDIIQQNPAVTIRRYNHRGTKDVKIRSSNKQNSNQHASSRNSRTSLKQNEQAEQISELRRQVQKLKQQNNLLHSQIKDNHSQLQILIFEHKENQEMKKIIQSLEIDLKNKEQQIQYLNSTVVNLNKQMEEIQILNINKRMTAAESLFNLEEINSQNLAIIKKLTEANKNFEIQLYLLKNREHQFIINDKKLKSYDALVAKNRELKIANLQLRNRLQSMNRQNLLLEYSPDTTER